MYEIPKIDWQKQKKREKVGVVVFILGILGIFAAVFLYISLGHNLDLTASDIDHQVGQLNGYSTIIFEGNESKNNNFVQKTDDNKDYEKANINNVQKYYRDKNSTICKIKCCDYSAYEEGEIFQRGEWKIGVISIGQQALNDILNSKKEQILKEDSNKKNQLSTSTENNDESKVFIEKSFTSIPVKTKTQAMINFQKKIENLYVENKADIVIVVAPHQDVLDVIDRADCVIANKCYDNIDAEGNSINSTYVMPVPGKDCIGTILSSPAKMLSAKIFQQIESD